MYIHFRDKDGEEETLSIQPTPQAGAAFVKYISDNRRKHIADLINQAEAELATSDGEAHSKIEQRIAKLKQRLSEIHS